VIVTRLGKTSDFLTASVNALLLVLEALDGTERGAQPLPHSDFGRLRDEFRRVGELYSRGPLDLNAWVLHLSDSFRTSPATEWAGIPRGGGAQGVPRVYVLSQLDADRVVCVVQGPSAEAFHELANRAGALLPCWPSQPYPSVLNDVGAFARYCDPEQFPWTIHSGDVWNRGMVTDHRGNVERWLGLAFALLMRDRLEHFNLATRPENVALTAAGGPINAVLTLRGMNLFAACARAIEMAELIPKQTLPPDLSTGSVTAAREVPTWEDIARRLLFQGRVCKQFKRPAPDQEKLLAAFQEECWPDAIDDPLAPGKLSRTVESLNDRLQHIKFRLNGAGTGVCWAVV
jgi:hypothetical protein